MEANKAERGWEDANGLDRQTQTKKLSERSELERKARLGKARAALALALERLAKVEKAGHHWRPRQ